METEGPSRRPWQAVGEAGDSSSNSRKRPRCSLPLPDLEDERGEEPVPEEEEEEEVEEEEDEEEEEEEEEEEDEEEVEQSGSEREYEYLDGCDGDGDDDAAEDEHDEQESLQGGGGRGDQPPQPQVVVQGNSNDDDDDDRPIIFSRALVHQRNDDDDGPIIFSHALVHQRSTAPASVPSWSSSTTCSDSSLIKDVTVNSTALDCGICFLPLKPPIFQCNIGHVVCCPCHDKLGKPSRCHVCRDPTPGGYHRCLAMEHLVDSIHVPCPHAAHGCTDRPVYHDREDHAQACAHAPCRCPGQACDFVGSTVALLNHFAAVHSWPCTTMNVASAGFNINLHDGFNFISAVCAGGSNQGTTNQYMFLLNVERALFGRTITTFCIHPHNTSTATMKLIYGRYSSFDMCCTHRQSSEFKVACTDLSNGLPDPSECFLFIVPRSACREDEEVTMVTVVITRPPINKL